MSVSKREVRWKPARGRQYRYGYIGETLVTARDGSVKVTERLTGKVHSRHPGVLQVQERGPRGGKRWVPLVIDDQDPEDSPWDQLSLFGGDAA